MNRLLKANCAVYWLTRSISAKVAIGCRRHLGSRDVDGERDPRTRSETTRCGSSRIGICSGHSRPPTPSHPHWPLRSVRRSGFLRLDPLAARAIRISLRDRLSTDARRGDLKSRFDVLLFLNGAARLDTSRAAGARSAIAEPDPETVPEQYRRTLGRISEDKTVPQLRKFLAAGGSVVTVGSSTGIATALGVQVRNALAEMGADGKEHPIPAAKFYVPGSLLKVTVDNTNPLAFGMPDRADVFFENSPVFRLAPDAARKHVAAVAWFEGPDVLASGWAWGPQYLSGATAIVDASVGEGRVVMLGPEVAFRAQPHGTFKLLFNALCYGSSPSPSN